MEDTAAGSTYDILAEFNEDGAELAFWVSQDGAVPTRHTVPVAYNQDGSFQDIDLAAVAPPLPGTLATNMILEMGDSGTDFTLKWLDPGLPVTSAAYEDVATISQKLDSVYSSTYPIYDSLGNKYVLEMTFKKLGINTWSWEASIDSNISLPIQGGSGIISFGPDGQILDPGDLTLEIDFFRCRS